MRHRKRKGQLGVVSSQREAMLRSLLLGLLKHERIKTTVAKAKQLSRYADEVIHVSKSKDLSAIRWLRIRIHQKEAISKLFDVYGPRFKGRNGGYTRIYRLGPRRGDAADMGLIEILPDASKENEPRIIKRSRVKQDEQQAGAEGLDKKAQKKQDKAKKRAKDKAQLKAESKKARAVEDVAHSHKSQGRKSAKGTGRSKTSKKGVS